MYMYIYMYRVYMYMYVYNTFLCVIGRLYTPTSMTGNWHSMVQPGLVWSSLVWCGPAWYSKVQPGMVWSSLA